MTVAEIPATGVDGRGEGVLVEVWRERRFLEMGVAPERAHALATDPRIDLHEFERLVAKGCSPRLADEILS